MYLKELKFRTFDALLASVIEDMEAQYTNGHIDGGTLVKVAVKINKELNIEGYRDAEIVLPIEEYKCALPLNFYRMNFALLCFNGEKTLNYQLPGKKYDGKCYCIKGCNGNFDVVEGLEIVQQCGTIVHTWRSHKKVQFADPSYLRKDCPNMACRSAFTAYIKDGYVHTNLKSGNLYIHYTPTMEDEDGNLLVIDHEIINDYYEYALKTKVLENMLMKGEQVSQLFQFANEQRRKAKIAALNLVSMPDFLRLCDYFKENRKRFIHKYFNVR